MAVKVEFSSETVEKEIFQNIRKFAGSNVSVDNDLSSDKRIEKQVFMELKCSLLSVSQRQKIQVLGKIGDKWFRFSNENDLMCGKVYKMGRASGGCLFGYKKSVESVFNLKFVELFGNVVCPLIVVTQNHCPYPNINCFSWNNDFTKFKDIISSSRIS